MAFVLKTAVAMAAVAGIQIAIAHPGEKLDPMELKREISAHKYASKISRDLEKYSHNPSYIELHGSEASPETKRDEAAWTEYNTLDHNMTGVMPAGILDPLTVFAANTTCALVPDTDVGPYYVLGEYIRSNVMETQQGVPVHVEVQFIDTNTCEPVASQQLVDFWQANATGVYSGVEASLGEGGLNTTFLRGVQMPDSDGVVQFDTIFPGHYGSRASHMHLARLPRLEARMLCHRRSWLQRPLQLKPWTLLVTRSAQDPEAEYDYW